MKFEGNVADNCRCWEQQFTVDMRAAEVSQKTPATQEAILLHHAGPEALEMYNTFTFEGEEDRNSVDAVLGKYKSYCQPRKNNVFERYKFWQRNQFEEPVDHWITDLKTRASTCEFGGECDNIIRDKIVFGVTERNLKERKLREADLTLGKAIDLWHAAEASKAHLKTMADGARRMAGVTMINKRRGRKVNCTSSNKPKKVTKRQTCNKCAKRYHFASVCRSAGYRKRVNMLHEDTESSMNEDEDDETYMYIDQL